MRFVNNIVLKKLDGNSILGSELENHEIFCWDKDKEYIELIYKDLVSSDLYKTFLKSKDESLKSDIVFIIEFLKLSLRQTLNYMIICKTKILLGVMTSQL